MRSETEAHPGEQPAASVTEAQPGERLALDAAADPNFRPWVSVVIPAWNSARTVGAAITSALAQGPDIEVIVVDDGSTDETAAVVRGLASPAVRLLSGAHAGLPAARNAGISLARAPLVAFLDSDDVMLAGWLAQAGAVLAADPDVGFAYTDAHVFDVQAGRFRRRSAMARSKPPSPPPSARDAFLTELLQRNFVFIATVVRAEVLRDLGGFDEALIGAEDYHLWLRIVLAGHTGTAVPGRYAVYRKHPLQISRQLTTMSDSLRNMYLSLPLGDMPTPAHRELLLRRRATAAREARLMRVAAPLLPMRAVEGAKRRGLGEAWFRGLPPGVDPAVREWLQSDGAPASEGG